jgi:lysophospholipase L1-like esterase
VGVALVWRIPDLAASGPFGQADVVLRGLSGYNTRWALKVLPRAMEGADPAAVTVFFGANDASLPDQVQAHQHVPLQEYQSNLRAICAYFKVILVISI